MRDRYVILASRFDVGRLIMATQQDIVLDRSGGVAAEAAEAVTALRTSVTGDLLDIVVDLESGGGCRFRDLRDGTEYLDMTMFFSSAPLGHGHPALAEPAFEADLVRAARVKPANPDFATVEQARFV